jgi:hypothetical protein
LNVCDTNTDFLQKQIFAWRKFLQKMTEQLNLIFLFIQQIRSGQTVLFPCERVLSQNPNPRFIIKGESKDCCDLCLHSLAKI